MSNALIQGGFFLSATTNLTDPTRIGDHLAELGICHGQTHALSGGIEWSLEHAGVLYGGRL